MDHSSLRVKCTVCDCVHNDTCENCNLNCIEITDEKTSANSMQTPHFCKSFCQR